MRASAPSPARASASALPCTSDTTWTRISTDSTTPQKPPTLGVPRQGRPLPRRRTAWLTAGFEGELERERRLLGGQLAALALTHHVLRGCADRPVAGAGECGPQEVVQHGAVQYRLEPYLHR